MKKIVHIDSGLGNQMLSFCEYLALRSVNPNDDCYVETLIYELPESHEFISQWNGYELYSVFGIDVPNVKSLFTDHEWKEIKQEILASRFWDHNWNYPVYFTEIFRKYGLNLHNVRGNFEENNLIANNRDTTKGLRSTYIWTYLKHLKQVALRDKERFSLADEANVFYSEEKDIFTGQRLTLKYFGSGIERIEKEVREVFRFPTISDNKNEELLNHIRQTHSVAIHIRRGDMLNGNFYCYKNGYFKRAVKYIKSKVSEPVFFIFCASDTVDWAKDNFMTLGLKPHSDKVVFADWNKDVNSWKDMYLMSQCQHNIITNSSFGWWSSWLNENPNKITCSPDSRIITTHFF